MKVFKYPITSPLASLKLACYLQDKGRALTDSDNEENAKKLYALGAKQVDIAETLSLKPSTISGYLSRTIKEIKERRRKQAFEMWLACYTQEEIADKVGVTQQTIANWSDDFTKSSDSEVLVNFRESSFKIPLYNIWKVQNKSNQVSHFGNTEAQWLDNLLYLYTDPYDVIIDPFGGGGSTIDTCKKRHRRYWVSDRKPIVDCFLITPDRFSNLILRMTLHPEIKNLGVPICAGLCPRRMAFLKVSQVLGRSFQDFWQFCHFS